jgi:hypothetical protein
MNTSLRECARCLYGFESGVFDLQELINFRKKRISYVNILFQFACFHMGGSAAGHFQGSDLWDTPGTIAQGYSRQLNGLASPNFIPQAGFNL